MYDIVTLCILLLAIILTALGFLTRKDVYRLFIKYAITSSYCCYQSLNQQQPAINNSTFSP